MVVCICPEASYAMILTSEQALVAVESDELKKEAYRLRRNCTCLLPAPMRKNDDEQEEESGSVWPSCPMVSDGEWYACGSERVLCVPSATCSFLHAHTGYYVCPLLE